MPRRAAPPVAPPVPGPPHISVKSILAFLSPVIPILSGAFAAWLFVHVHFLGIFHVSQSQAATDVASGITFALTAGLVWLSHQLHWLPLAGRQGGPAYSKAKILAFISPYISIVVGAGVAWLFVHVHFLGIFHLQQGTVAQTVASAIVFGVGALITWSAHTFHWLPIKLTLLLTPK